MVEKTKCSKAQLVEDYFRRQILTGKIVPGEKLPTEESIRSRFQVGNSTVREAIGSLVSDGLVERRQGAGTFALESVGLQTIVVVANLEMLTETASVYYYHLLRHIQAILCSAGYGSTIVLSNDETLSSSGSGYESLRDPQFMKKVSGVLSVVGLGDLEEELREEDIPVVSIVHHRGGFSDNVIELDYQALIRQGVGEFFDAGIEDIAVFLCEGDDDLMRRKSRGRLLRWFRECGVTFPENRFVSVPMKHIEDGYQRFMDFWNSTKHPEGIFFLDDMLCDVVLRAISELKISVPGDLALVTSSNVEKKFFFPVPLTQIQFNPEEIARQGCDMMFRLLQGEQSVALETSQPNVIKGRSVLR